MKIEITMAEHYVGRDHSDIHRPRPQANSNDGNYQLWGEATAGGKSYRFNLKNRASAGHTTFGHDHVSGEIELGGERYWLRVSTPYVNKYGRDDHKLVPALRIGAALIEEIKRLDIPAIRAVAVANLEAEIEAEIVENASRLAHNRKAQAVEELYDALSGLIGRFCPAGADRGEHWNAALDAIDFANTGTPNS